MAEVVTYRNDQKHCFCQLKLQSGERILISIGSGSIKVYKMILWGQVPVRVLWEAKRPEDIRVLSDEERDFEESPLDLLVERVRECRNISEVIALLS